MKELTNFYSQFFSETELSDWESTFEAKDSGQRLKTYPRLPRHPLPSPALPATLLSDALFGRYSALDLRHQVFSLSEVSTLLAAVGLRQTSGPTTDKRRTYPSAGARYPGETYIIALACESIPPGLYHYVINEHELEELWAQDLREPLLQATADRRTLSASLVFIFTLVYGRTAEKYGKRSLRYGLIEFGHMAQNIALAAHALGKGCYEIGGFIDSTVNAWLDIDGESETAALLIALGGK